MSVMQASDLYIPEVCAAYASKAFRQSLEFYMLIGQAGSPIELMNDPFFDQEGQYKQRPTWDRVGSTLVARRDVTSSAALTPLAFTGTNEKMVKCHRRLGPVDASPDAFRLSKATPAEFSAELGTQAGQELALNIQHSLLAASNGIIDGSTTTHTSTTWAAATRTNLSPSVIQGGLTIMGDQQESFRRETTLIMRSESFGDLRNDAIGRSFTNVGDRALQGETGTNRLGMNAAVVDDSTLTVADAGFDKYITLMLGARFLQVGFSLPMTVYPTFIVLDQEQVVYRWRADADFYLGTHGATWDSGNGGANPTDANLALSTNWDTVYGNHRELRGVKLVHNYSGN